MAERTVLQRPQGNAPQTKGENWLSRFWGPLNDSANNIIGVVLLVLLIFAVLYTFLYPFIVLLPEAAQRISLTPKELWDLLTPALLAMVGYLVGRAR